jgi:hypothetical protein
VTRDVPGAAIKPMPNPARAGRPKPGAGAMRVNELGHISGVVRPMQTYVRCLCMQGIPVTSPPASDRGATSSERRWDDWRRKTVTRRLAHLVRVRMHCTAGA